MQLKKLLLNFIQSLNADGKKWMQEGFPEENKKVILQKYPKKQHLYTEALKINLEIASIMSEVAIKRDQHFLESQNCVGSAISALAAAMSMILEDPEDGIDQEVLTKYLCDVGKLLTDVFHQQSVARKSFITPLLNEAVKPTIEAIKSDEWLYGKKFAEQVKEVQAIGKACATLKAPDKSSKVLTQKPRVQRNLKYPPVRYKQVGGYPRRSTIRFKTKNQRTSRSTRVRHRINRRRRSRGGKSPSGSPSIIHRSVKKEKYILNCLKGYQIPFKEIPREHKSPKDIVWSETDQIKLMQEINRLISINAVEECEEDNGQFVSSYFLVPKSDGSSRFIFN